MQLCVVPKNKHDVIHLATKYSGVAKYRKTLTCLFQATPLMSSSGWSLLPGDMGLSGLFKSQMNISDSLAPEARRLGWKGLKSMVRTGPVWWTICFNWAPSVPLCEKS